MANKVFISWSGETSRKIALELKAAFESASRGQIQCFISVEDILPGDVWTTKIMTAFDECDLAIFCLTKENINSPWLYFEAGAVSATNKPIIPVLINCDFDDVRKSPLSTYQSIKLFDDASRRKLVAHVTSIFKLDGESRDAFNLAFPAQLLEVREKSGDAKYHHYISSMEEYIQVVSSIDISSDGKLKSSKKISNRQANIFYRGQTIREKQEKGIIIPFDPKPSVFRVEKYNEHEIYNQIMTECAHEFSDCTSHCETLAKMQHYGTPTRLLDITTNALAALFFACVDENGKTNNKSSGVVFIIQSDEKHVKVFDSDAITILSSLPRFSVLDKEAIKMKAFEALKNPNTISHFNNVANDHAVIRLLHEIRKEKPAFESKINPQDVVSNFIFTPQKTNARIIRQSGAFVIFGLGTSKLPCHGEDADFEGEPKVIAEIHISKKEAIKRTLEKCGISLATMYPELYKVSQYVSGRMFDG